MRNLKRALSLALASVMLMGMMVVGTSAASYPDVDDQDHVEAIEVLSAVGVIVGDNGDFRPNDSVSRNEMAVIMAKLILGTYEADSYVGSHPFTDVPDWASRYVAACYNSGIISGRGEGIYDGASTVTAVEAAAMMLRALGYEDLSLGATQWDRPVAAKANEINLFKGLSGNSQTPMDRNSVAQLSLNTLEATMVTTVRGGQDITLPDGTVIASTRTYSDRSDPAGRDYNGDDDKKLQLCEHLYKDNLEKKAYANDPTAVDDFGRPATIWEYKGKEVISVANDATLTYTKEVKAKDIYKALGLRTSDNADHIVNGYNVGTVALSSTASSTLNSGNGTLTQVYKDDNGIVITVIETFLAQVSGDYDEDDEELTLTPVSDDSALGNVDYTLKLEDFANLADFADEDYVLFTAKTDGADATVKTLVPAEVVTATVNGYTKDSDGSTPKDVTFDGKTYEYNVNFDAQGLDTNYTVKEESVFIMDGYDYVIGLDEVANSNDYVFILEFKSDGWNTSKTVSANAYFTDGTNKDIKLEKVNGKSIDGVTSGAPGVTTVEVDGTNYYAGWYTYTEKNNAYRVTGTAGSAPSAVGNNTKVIENGKATIKLAGAATSKGSDKTILVVKDGNDIDVYTGVKEMPTITTDSASSKTYAWVSEKSNGYASYVFVDVANGDVEGASSASGDLIFIMDEGSYKVRVDEDDNTYYLYDKAIVNGKSESVKAASSTTFPAPGLYHSVRYDENEFVDDADLAIDADEDYIVNDLSGATVAGEAGTVEVGGTSMRLADEFVIRVVTDEKKMVTIKDAEALNNRYKNKVVDGKLWAALKDDEVTTLILVATNVVDAPSGSAAVKAVYESTSAVTDAAVTTVPATSSIAGVTVNLSSANEADKMNTVKTALAGDGTFNTSWDVSEPDGTTKVITVTNKTPGTASNPDSNFFVEATAGKDAVPAVNAVYDSGTVTALTSDGDLEICGISANISNVSGANNTLTAQLNAWMADATVSANADWDFALNDDGDGIKFTAKTAGAIGQTGPANAPTGATEVTEGAEEIAAVAAVYTLDPSKVLLGGSAMEIHGKKYAVTGADLAEKLAAWVQAYKSDSGNTEWDAAVKAGELKVVFTAKTAGALATTGATAPTDTTEVTAGADAVTP